MAIRIRKINGITVALCAAKTQPETQDIYLDDSAHHALSAKFNIDWLSEGLLKTDLVNEEEKKIIMEEENKQVM